jgi:hypothetical protein
MGNVGFNYTHGNLNCCRAYIKGFTVQSGVTLLTLTGHLLKFEYTPAALRWELLISDEFFPATSNTYSFDHVFDAANCFSFASGSPFPTTINFGLMFIPDEGSFRLGTEPALPGDPAQHVELPAVANYWLPI